ncbi:MAG: homocysteine S-methyltransferase family protein [Pseudomonadota bacterium]
MSLLKRLEDGPPLLMDGAMGTELDRRGIKMDAKAWSASGLAGDATMIRAVHDDYIAAGAQVHIVNSFALARHVLEPAGLGDQVAALNRRAVEICRDALAAAPDDRPQWIAGSLSTYAAQSDRSALPRGATLVANFREQAEVLRDAGCDLFALEMLCDVEITLAMIEAVAPLGLPVMPGFTCIWGPDDRSVETLAREVGLSPMSLEDALNGVLPKLPEGLPAILAIMHSDLDVSDPALEIARAHWSGPLAVYPNSGRFAYPNWRFEEVCAPEAFVAAAERWTESGAILIGGCCGIGPAHIAALGKTLAA